MNWEAVAAVSEMLGAILLSPPFSTSQQKCVRTPAKPGWQRNRRRCTSWGMRSAPKTQDREWAKLLSRALKGLQQLDPVERVQFLSHVGSIFRLYESAHLHYVEGSLDPRFWRGFERAIADVIGYPGIREALELRKHHLTDEFSPYLDQLMVSSQPRKIFAEPAEVVTPSI